MYIHIYIYICTPEEIQWGGLRGSPAAAPPEPRRSPGVAPPQLSSTRSVLADCPRDVTGPVEVE